MRHLRFDRAFAGLAILLIGCGGKGGQTEDAGSGDGGASCAAVSPCGGNIVGTWKVTSSCLTATQDLTSVCAGASAELAYMISGTVTYNSDGTTSSSLMATIAAHERFPSGCMPFGLTCDQLGQTGKDAGISDNCTTDATGACICDSVAPATTSNAPVTYSTSGSTLTTTSANGMTSTSFYCVQGSVLYEFAGPGDGGLTATGGVVLNKQ